MSDRHDATILTAIAAAIDAAEVCGLLVDPVAIATAANADLIIVRAFLRWLIKLGGRMLRISTSRFGFVAGAGVAAAEKIAGNQHNHVVYRRGVVGQKDKG